MTRFDSPDSVRRTVLLVHDHPSIRLILGAALTAQDFTLLTAGSGAQALEICRDYPGTIDVLLSDVGLTAIKLKREEAMQQHSLENGATVMKHALAMRPSLKVVFFSGHSDKNLTALGVSDQPWPILRKPCDLRSLLKALRVALHVAA
jgi:two-component system cell cycle sensor histidine kinase/response regulator CckA